MTNACFLKNSEPIRTDLLSHRQFEFGKGQPTHWSESLNCWCVFDPATVKALLEDESVRVVEYSKELKPLAERAHIDVGGAMRVLDHIPLANEGARHSQARRELSKLNNATYSDRLERLKTELSLRQDVFHQTGVVDITEAFFHPVIDAITLPDLRLKIERQWPGPSQIFDRFLSLNRRRKVYQTIDDLYGVADQDDIGHKDALIALRILGYDALLGSMEASFLHVVQAHNQLPLDQMHWPQTMPATAVPTVERIAGRDMSLEGHTVRCGDRLRLFLATDNATADLFFGSGRHKCVGAGISQKIWQAFAEVFSKQTCKVEVLEVTYPQGDFVFNCPNTINIRITTP